MKLNIKVDFILFVIKIFMRLTELSLLYIFLYSCDQLNYIILLKYFLQDNFKTFANAQENEVFYIIFTFTFYILMDLGMINGVNASGISRRVWKDEVKDYNTNESKLQQPQVTSIQRISSLIKLSLCQLFSSNVWIKLET